MSGFDESRMGGGEPSPALSGGEQGSAESFTAAAVGEVIHRAIKAYRESIDLGVDSFGYPSYQLRLYVDPNNPRSHVTIGAPVGRPKPADERPADGLSKAIIRTISCAGMGAISGDYLYGDWESGPQIGKYRWHKGKPVSLEVPDESALGALARAINNGTPEKPKAGIARQLASLITSKFNFNR